MDLFDDVTQNCDFLCFCALAPLNTFFCKYWQIRALIFPRVCNGFSWNFTKWRSFVKIIALKKANCDITTIHYNNTLQLNNYKWLKKNFITRLKQSEGRQLNLTNQIISLPVRYFLSIGPGIVPNV